jgi:hypothetical protein
MTIHMTWQIISTCIIYLFCQIQLCWDFKDEVIFRNFLIDIKNVIFDGEAAMYGTILRPRYAAHDHCNNNEMGVKGNKI